jgi:hypothetical protein
VVFEKAHDVVMNTVEIAKDLGSRNYCVAALLFGLAVGIASLVVGCEIVVSGKVKLPGFLRGK